MDYLETVEGSEIISCDPLYKKQQEDVAKMRTSLLACSNDPDLVKASLKQITILRAYHQMSRIIRYLDMMDKIEDKLYSTIDDELNNSDSGAQTMILLLEVQERLQRSMIESQKLIAPYIDLTTYISNESVTTIDASDTDITIMNSTEREDLRRKAQDVIHLLKKPADELKS